jgi:hypothetical protein
MTIYGRARTFLLFSLFSSFFPWFCQSIDKRTENFFFLFFTLQHEMRNFSPSQRSDSHGGAGSRLKVPANESTVKAELKADDDEKKSRFSGCMERPDKSRATGKLFMLPVMLRRLPARSIDD